MKAVRVLAIFATLMATSLAVEQPSFHTKGTPTGHPSGKLKPGEYWWHPEVSPNGPVMVLVSLPQQTLHVFRNGVLIGRSSISSGRPGHSTPAGVYTILEKAEVHHSKTYHDAPMPYMQRLTWEGIAMHSGQLPGYAASHGCVRLPFDFSNRLYTVTSRGGTVIIGNDKTPEPRFAANPGLLLAPADFKPEMLHPLAANEYDWHPERSTKGPITMVMSSADHAIYVYRNGEIIGRAELEVRGRLGTHVFTMLAGGTGKESRVAPGREAKRWMHVSGQGRAVDADKIASQLQFSPEFGQKVADELQPGATVVVTDQVVVRKPAGDAGIFAAN
jgi:hypothetical protein